jgi:uncharacterized cupredoxin-like copper-binding protein
MNRLITTFFLALLVAGPVHAHGNTHRAAHDPAKAEQVRFGKAGDPKKATRTIRIAMTDDMRFSPDAIEVRQGETVKFVVSNKGSMLHEMVIGTPAELKAHAEQMKKFPDMEHDEPHMVHVKPGQLGQIVWTFNRAGEFVYACLIAGHFEAGMTGIIRVLEKK